MRMARNVLIAVIAAFAALVVAPQHGLADCPDELRCSLYQVDGGYGKDKDLGVMKTPTCWKLGQGCRPWNCSAYNGFDRTKWVNMCIQQYAIKPSTQKNITFEQVCVAFKEGIGDLWSNNYCLPLK